jgi:alpha-methylacyl-CoA racemase
MTRHDAVDAPTGSPSSRPAGALHGVRVLDLTRLLPGPFATMVLADLGASVDKLEDLGGGDYLRHMPPLVGEHNAAFAMLNRGKRNLALDLKHEEGRRAFEDLVLRYDVVVETFRPGVLDRLGVGPATLRARDPRLVFCSISGFGQTGPDAGRAGHDLTYIARAGVLGSTGPTSGAPQPPGFQLADMAGALWAVIGILAALRERELTGTGRHVDIAMNEAALPFGIMTLMNALAGGRTQPGAELLTGGIAPYRTYETKDGRAVALAALEPKFWTAFAAEAGVEAGLDALVPGPHQAALHDRLAATFRKNTHAEWSAWARARDVMLEPIALPEELPRDAQLAARSVFFDLAGSTQFRTPVGDPSASTPAASRGAHTREVLLEAGFAPSRIDELHRNGAAR